MATFFAVRGRRLDPGPAAHRVPRRCDARTGLAFTELVKLKVSARQAFPSHVPSSHQFPRPLISEFLQNAFTETYSTSVCSAGQLSRRLVRRWRQPAGARVVVRTG